MKYTKRLMALFIFFCAVFVSTTGIYKVNATNANKLVIHYFRYDNEYTDWNLWIWKLGASGKQYDFTDNDDYGKTVEIDLAGSNIEGATQVGFIVKKGGWDEKDIDMDRFIDMSKADENGVVNVYLVQQDINIGYSIDDPNGPDRSDKIMSSYFSSSNTISFRVTTPITKGDLKLYANDSEINYKSFSISGVTGTITLNNDVDMDINYELEVQFDDKVSTKGVSFDGLYDTTEFEEAFTYDGDDLGVTYSKTSTTFKLWAPISKTVKVCLYDTGAGSTVQPNGDDSADCTPMKKGDKGVWDVTINGDLDRKYYTYKVMNGSIEHEVVDPYVVTTGVNGIRGMVLDLNSTDPVGWKPNKKPNNMKNYTDAIIYELHVRDLTSHKTWNGKEEWRGKFLGLTESGTTYTDRNDVTVKTGLDHLKELGITHLHLLPSFDFGVVDETRLGEKTYQLQEDGVFNWGYMPLHFNSPEGSYSTDPYNGEVRVNEYKQMVQALHDNNIRVVMDVVYNHTGLSGDSNFNLIIPGYYHRMTDNGGFSNGSGTGNETASERSMVRKYVVDSVLYWAKEYNIDGFRFDLMGLHDIDTMKELTEELHKIDPTIIVYGEPWNGGTSVMDASIAADKTNIKNLAGVAAFNDDIRDAVKGSVWEKNAGGFIQGNFTDIEKIKYGIVGGISHSELSDSFNVWHTDPTRTVNYVSAHDNNTLFDKIRATNPSATTDQTKNMQKQANAIVLTSQGISFLHAGVDFMRSKGGDDNSYNKPDRINQLDWSLKAKNLDVFNYYQGLIELRKEHPAFRMTKASSIQKNLEFLSGFDNGIIAYKINDFANNDTWGDILVIHNGNKGFKTITLPEGKWNVVVNQEEAGTKIINTVSGEYIIKGSETLVLYQGEKEGLTTTQMILIGGAGLIVLSTGGIFLFLKRRSV